MGTSTIEPGLEATPDRNIRDSGGLGEADQGTLRSGLEGNPVPVGLVEIGLASPKDGDATPGGIEHAGGPAGEALQELREVAGLGGVNGQLHQLVGVLADGTRKRLHAVRARNCRRRFGSCSRHV
jgi:hypothetical protein